MPYSKQYQEKKDEIEGYIGLINDYIIHVPKTLQSSILYSLQNGGKRIRPILFLECFKIFGGKIDEAVINFALAIECIHTYSLIHDDLPCMDNDDFRRGKPTNHKVYGEGMAVLAGDALLNLAYELIFDGIASSNYNKNYIDAARVLSKAVGASGLVGGQSEDILPINEKLSPSKIDYIYKHKTGDLLCAACVCGTMIAGASESDVEKIRNFGGFFGIGFQIKDDILDYEEASDSDKRTYVKIFGLEKTNQALFDSIENALKVLSEINQDTEFLRKLALKSATRKV